MPSDGWGLSRPKGLTSAEEPTVSVNHGRALPNARMRRLLLAIQEVMGRGGLMTVLRQARLHRFTTNLPLHNQELRIQAAEYAGLLHAIELYYGRGARGTLIRVGRAAFRQLLANERLAALGQRASFVLASRERRCLAVLRWLAHTLAQPQGRVEVHADGRGLAVLDYEGDGSFGRQREAPACWVTVGKLQEALRWATGRDYDVVETECKGCGAPACRFEINPIED